MRRRKARRLNRDELSNAIVYAGAAVADLVDLIQLLQRSGGESKSIEALALRALDLTERLEDKIEIALDKRRT